VGRPDATALLGGALIALFGVVLLLDASGTLDLSFAAFGPMACALVGAILLVSGLTRRD
jgi:hypothetical protein